MRKLSHGEILDQRLTPEDAVKSNRHPISLMLENVRSLYNVGSIFRTADSALAAELILCGFTPHPPRKEIEKTALGAVDSVPWRYEENIEDAIRSEQAKGIKVIAVELTDEHRAYDSIRFEEYPICLVVGNELTGLDDKTIALCDDAVEIPMYGVKHSLNVSIATGIALFEAVRLWKRFEK